MEKKKEQQNKDNNMEHVQNNNAGAKQRDNEIGSCSHTEMRLGGGADVGDNVVGRGRRNLDGRIKRLT